MDTLLWRWHRHRDLLLLIRTEGSDENVPLEEIMSHAKEYYYRGAVRMFEMIKAYDKF